MRCAFHSSNSGSEKNETASGSSGTVTRTIGVAKRLMKSGRTRSKEGNRWWMKFITSPPIWAPSVSWSVRRTRCEYGSAAADNSS